MSTLPVEMTETRARLSGRACDPAFSTLVAALRSTWIHGSLILNAPDGRAYRIGGSEQGLEARIDVSESRFVRRVLTGGDIGFADSFVAGEWDSPDLARLLTVFSANFDAISALTAGSLPLRIINSVAHALRRNSRAGSRRNISEHYDLGNAFYALWLDEGMNYSSALYAPGVDDLASAQVAKHRALAEAMDLRAGHRLLEIGCGWGDFAIFAARDCGAEVTAVTVSRAQYALASARVHTEGLADRVQVVLQDYRDLSGDFDRIVSIEMFEAVGEAYWPTYFTKLAALLRPGGRAGLQVITIEEALFEGYRRRPDFIQLHVFPGGMLPSEDRLQAEAARVGLTRTSIVRFGQDYARTLAEWAHRYARQASAVRAQGFDMRFDRLWRYYLAYCEAGFRTGRTDVVQVGLAKL